MTWITGEAVKAIDARATALVEEIAGRYDGDATSPEGRRKIASLVAQAAFRVLHRADETQEAIVDYVTGFAAGLGSQLSESGDSGVTHLIGVMETGFLVGVAEMRTATKPGGMLQ